MVKLVAVYGPPGTGKTTYLLNKFVEECKENHYLPTEILYATFRRPMAEDFKRRLLVRKITESRDELLFVSTIHSVAWRLLAREFSWTKSRNVALPWVDYVEFCKKLHIPISKEDVVKVKQALSENNVVIASPQDFESLGFKIYSIYCNCINTLTPFEKFNKLPEYMLPVFSPTEMVDSSFIVHVIDKWVKWLETNEKVDFAMMLWKCLELKLSPEVSVAMFDEAHDMTPIQWRLFLQWIKECNDVYVAFDLAQTIYSFWGVKPQYCIKVWEKAHEKIVLTPSYRLSKTVYNLARKILKKSGQKAPDIECVGETRVRWIPSMSFDRVIEAFKPITVLVRTKYHISNITTRLDSLGVIYRSIFGHGWNDKMLTIYKVLRCIKNNNYNFSKSEFITLIKCVRDKYLTADKNHLVRIIKLNELTSNLINNCFRSSFFEIVKNSNPFSHDILLKSSEDSYGFSADRLNVMSKAWDLNKPARIEVLIYTIHAAKGLEWDYVLVIDGITRKIERYINLYKEEYQNEHRVWYVAFTRARKILFYSDSFLFKSGLDIPFLSRIV